MTCSSVLQNSQLLLILLLLKNYSSHISTFILLPPTIMRSSFKGRLEGKGQKYIKQRMMSYKIISHSNSNEIKGRNYRFKFLDDDIGIGASSVQCKRESWVSNTNSERMSHMHTKLNSNADWHNKVDHREGIQLDIQNSHHSLQSIIL